MSSEPVHDNEPGDGIVEMPVHRSLWMDVWQQYRNHTGALVGTGVFVFIVLAHEQRRIIHFNVTEHPTAQWTAQQLVEAFPFDTAPRISYETAMAFTVTGFGEGLILSVSPGVRMDVASS